VECLIDALTSSLWTQLRVQKWKQRKETIGTCSLARTTSRVEGCVGAPRWVLGRVTNKSITHTHTYTNQTTSWLMHSWNTFGAQTSRRQTWTHRTHHGPDLGEATTFPLIAPKCHFVPGPPNGSPEILKIRTPATLEAHKFVWKSPIEVRSKEKL
jgi:hypothetical protein